VASNKQTVTIIRLVRYTDDDWTILRQIISVTGVVTEVLYEGNSYCEVVPLLFRFKDDYGPDYVFQ